MQIDEFGGPEVLTPVSAPDLAPAPGSVLIEVEAAGVTFAETQVRAGRPPWPGPLPTLPLVLGNGVAGRVTAVGDGVAGGLVGARVTSATGGSGGYSELAVVSAAALHTVPGRVATADAVALLADGRTAMAILRAAALRPGERVLVLAAAGGVGTLLVQLAAAAGADVVAAASHQAKLTTARELADAETHVYAPEGWRGPPPHPVHAVLDGVGGPVGRFAAGLLMPGGRLVAYGAASGSFTTLDALPGGTRLTTLPELIRSPEDNYQLVEQALHAAARGGLRPVVGQEFPLHRAGDAHAAIERRATIGKTVLLP